MTKTRRTAIAVYTAVVLKEFESDMMDVGKKKSERKKEEKLRPDLGRMKLSFKLRLNGCERVW